MGIEIIVARPGFYASSPGLLRIDRFLLCIYLLIMADYMYMKCPTRHTKCREMLPAKPSARRGRAAY